MREALAQEVDQGETGYWDPDAWEEEVIEFTRRLGRRIKPGLRLSKQKLRTLPRCGGRRQHRWQPLWWLSVRIVQAPYLRCPGEPQPVAGHRPFQELTGLKCRGKSWPLQRALTDFGAEKSFVKEHYGVELHRSSIREVVLKHGERAAGLVDLEDREAVSG